MTGEIAEDAINESISNGDDMEGSPQLMSLARENANLRQQLSAVAKALAWEAPYQASLATRAEAIMSARDALKEREEKLTSLLWRADHNIEHLFQKGTFVEAVCSLQDDIRAAVGTRQTAIAK